jgi:hypothetical protein
MDNKMVQFKGFKPQAMQRIAGTLGYQGDMSGFNDYLNQNPDKKQQMNMYQQKAMQMLQGGLVKMQEGGQVPNLYNAPNSALGTEIKDNTELTYQPTLASQPNMLRTDSLPTTGTSISEKVAALGKASGFLGAENQTIPTPTTSSITSTISDPRLDQTQLLTDKTFEVDPMSDLRGGPIKPLATDLSSFSVFDQPKETFGISATPPAPDPEVVAKQKAKIRKQSDEEYAAKIEKFGPVQLPSAPDPVTGIRDFKYKGYGNPDEAYPVPVKRKPNYDPSTIKTDAYGRKVANTINADGTIDTSNFISVEYADKLVDEAYQKQLEDYNKLKETLGENFTKKQAYNLIRTENLKATKEKYTNLDPDYFESQEYFEYLEYGPKVGGMAVTYSPYFGFAGSTAIGAHDIQYEKYLERTGKTDMLAGGSSYVEPSEDNPWGMKKPSNKSIAESNPTMTPNQANTTIADIMAERAQAPSLPAGATVQPVGTTITSDQLIGSTTGQVGAAPTVSGVATVDAATAEMPEGMDAASVTAVTATPKVGEALAGIQDVTGTVSPQAQVEAAQGTISPDSLAKAVGVDPKYIQEVQAGTRTVSQNEIASAAKALNIPIAQAQKLLSPVVTADAAKFKDTAPQVTAVTDYDTGKMGVAEGTVKPNEIVKAQGVGLTAEQSNAATSNYESTLESARGKVAEGETITSQDYYNLPATDIANIQKTAVEKAAKASTVPEAGVATSSYNSAVEGAKGRVGSKELVDAEAQGLQIGQAVEAVAAISSELNKAATAVAQQGTMSQYLAEAASINQTAKSTVQGQMADLMGQFASGTPTWAAGAMRAANAAMSARGLGASSIASAAIVQATMESALPIAQADAKMLFEANIANANFKQQVSLANAAAQQNMELANLNNRQQAALANSTNAFTLQTQNLSNEQSVVLANAQFKAAVQQKNLDVKTQTSLVNAARYAEVNNINLNNSQQAILQRSSENLQVDMANLSNQQQTALSNLQVQASIAGQELTNEQQMAVLTSSQAFEAAEFEATVKQQAFMQDAQSRAALEGKAMDIRQQTALFNAARVAEVNDINLTNEQQVRLQKSTESLQIEVTNLSNRQQTALANAQIRASLQGKILDNKQQAAIINAERYAEVNNINLSNKQQAFVQEYAARTAFEGQAISNSQQAAIFNVSSILEERQIELSNEQQTNLFNATNRMTVDMTELSNRQQTAIANLQVESTLRGQELQNEQQVAIVNAERFAEANNLQYTTEQQMTLANSQMMQTIGLAEMSSANTAALQNAAQLAGMDMANLDARQQAAVQNAQAFLGMDMANLTNRQQTNMFKAQAMQQAILSDQAVENAAAQFNATSENQVNQFMINLAAQVSQFNTTQQNATKQFNAGEANAINQFNAQIQNQRDQFNASNQLVIAQNNANWRRQVATEDTAAINRANEINAANMLAISNTAYDNLWNYYSDTMEYVWTSAESERERVVDIAIANLNNDAAADAASAANDYNSSLAFGNLIGSLFTTPLSTFGSSIGGSAVGAAWDWLTG